MAFLVYSNLLLANKICYKFELNKVKMNNAPKYRQEWILKLLKGDGNISYVKMWADYKQKWAKGKSTFDKDWKAGNLAAKKYHDKLQSKKESASISIEVQALKQGLKLKIDRLMFYQNQIGIMELQLIGHTKFKFLVGNTLMPSHDRKGIFILPLEKQNEIRKQIKEYQTEISKIEGDYASVKKDITSNGQTLIVSDADRDKRIQDLKEKLLQSQ